MCALGVDTNYRDLTLPNVAPLDIPLHGQNMFKRAKRSTFPNVKSSSLFLQSGVQAKENQEEDQKEDQVVDDSEDQEEDDKDQQSNDHEKTGDNTHANDNLDEEVPITPSASAGWSHSAVVSSNGELWVWGRTHDMINTLRVNRKSRLQAWMLGTKRSVDSLTPSPVEIPGVGLPLPREDGYEKIDVDAYSLQLRDDLDISRKVAGGPSKDYNDTTGLLLPKGPLSMSFDDRVIKAACGGALTGCVTESGRAFLFGDNRVGQCGNGAPSEREWNPVRLRGIDRGERVVDLALGYQHGVACTASGRVYAWGKGDRGQLGIGGKRSEHTATPLPLFDKAPTRVPSSVMKLMSLDEGGSDGAGVGGGGRAVVGEDGVLRIEGETTSSSDSSHGGEEMEMVRRESSDGSDGDDISLVTAGADGLERGERPRAVAVCCGFSHSATLDHEGQLWVWGKFLSETRSEDGTRYADQFTPRLVEGIDDRIVMLTCGQFHTTVIGSSGRMWMVGMKGKTEVEEEDDVLSRFSPQPKEIPGAHHLDVTHLRGGWSTTTVVTKDGKVYDATWQGIRGPKEELAHLFVHDVAPGFRHRVVLSESRRKDENESNDDNIYQR